ncbi:endothelial lipase-like [Anoplophora glabripennis]|uniref:endothelial lipase-like n=1 Tax=Anoplophora glabripennis TaxID=217634 RepID=UPI000873E320|nr:endothelial lipase-like [Anoplophora glabripennis]
MKVYLLVAALLPLVLSGPAFQGQSEQEDDGADMKYFLYESSPGVYKVEDLVNAEIDTMVSESDVYYHFFSRSDPNGVDIRNTNIDALRNTGFSVQRDTVFIVHGWRGDNDASSNRNIRQAILSKHNINLFVVDWGPIASRNYITAKNSVVRVGRIVASFVQALQSRFSVRLSTVSFVGFSLGAHVSGAAGAALKAQINHIVGLDPAGPLFSVRNTDERLDPTDAKFVQVIHTNGGLLGFRDPAGHSDYYPNGGSSQPGCGLDIAGTCAHNRAYLFYTESILADTNRFVSTRCSSHRDYTRGNCNGNARSVLGGYAVDKKASGDYYLDTNNRSPFARG